MKSSTASGGQREMRAFERREAGMDTGPIFKVATWDARSFTWKDGKTAFPSQAEASAAIVKPGRYRVSRGEGGEWSSVAEIIV